MGQMGRQPLLALRECLRVGVDGLKAFQRVSQAQKIVPHHQADFADDVQWGVEQQVERSRHHTLGGIFNWHDAVAGTASCRGAKYFIEADAGHMFNAGAKKLQRRLFAECPCRAEVGHRHWGFKRQAGRHDFAPNSGDMIILEGACVGLLDFFNHLGHAVGPKKCRAFVFLDLANFLGDQRALVQELKQFSVKGINLET